MPSYEFECEPCKVVFTRVLKMGDHQNHPCPGCQQEAPRVWDTGVSFSFGGAPSSSGKANTGVHSNDYPTADRVVGVDAEARWSEYHDRERVKTQARTQGSTHALIRHTDKNHIDYEPMTPLGQKARKNMAHSMFATIKAQREERRARSR